jgi:Na+/melibiose symporter-like transporter
MAQLMFYTTEILHLNAAIVGTLLMATRLLDGVTDIFAGYIVDRTNTRWGKARPYEFAILLVWVAMWAMYATPTGLSDVFKYVWVFTAYSIVNAVGITLLSANNNAYMIRAFSSNAQRVKIASLGGGVIMIAAVAINIIFPMLLQQMGSTAEGWRVMMAGFAIPMALIGILRFVFVKETNPVEVSTDPPKVKDIFRVLRANPYALLVAAMYFLYSAATGLGIATYYFKYIVGNISLMGIATAVSVLVVPLLFIFPAIMKKISMGKLIVLGSIAALIGNITMFFAEANFTVILIANLIGALGILPVTYLTDLLMIDCASYNEWKGEPRMDGTIGAVKGLAGKVGGAVGAAIVGAMLGWSGYQGGLEVQPDSAMLMIRVIMAVVPGVLNLLILILMSFYKLDKLIPQINSDLEERRQAALLAEVDSAAK